MKRNGYEREREKRENRRYNFTNFKPPNRSYLYVLIEISHILNLTVCFFYYLFMSLNQTNCSNTN